MPVTSEYKDLAPNHLEWTLTGLNFSPSTEEFKRNKIESRTFGDGGWQVSFYPNGLDGEAASKFASIFLVCKPTDEEKRCAESKQWVRAGTFGFSFEIISLDKSRALVLKRALKHRFSQNASSWGWQEFILRGQFEDGFVLVCDVFPD